MRGQRVVDLVSQVSEMYAVTQQRWRNARKGGESNSLPPTFKAEEDEILILADRSSHDSAELVLVVLGLGSVNQIVLKSIGVENLVAEVVEDVTVPILGAALNGGVDHAAAEAAIGGVIGICHYLEFFHRPDVGRKLPGAAVVADRRAVQQKEVLTRTSAVDFV